MNKLTIVLFLCICISVSRAEAQYSNTATTRIYRGDPRVLIDEDSHTGTAPVSATSSHFEGVTAATNDATAGFNDLHVRSSIVSDSNAPEFLVTSLAEWKDQLFFRKNGQFISADNVRVTVHLQGNIDIQPPTLIQWGGFNVTLGNRGVGREFGFNGPYDDFYTSTQSASWNATEGLALTFRLSAHPLTDANITSSLVDFSTGARITNIEVIGPNGQPDPTVVITSSSGTSYVPEPAALALLICGIGAICSSRLPRTYG
jgi:hypothetical protein